MLKKLIKYEWKSFWKVPAIINLSLIIITIIGIISLVSPFWKIQSALIDVLLVSSVLFYYVALFAGSTAVTVYIAIRYYKNIYTDEGYLINTLPVNPRQLILSKLIIGVIWTLITLAVTLLSVLSLIYAAGVSYGGFNIFKQIAILFAEISPVLTERLGMSMFSLMMYLIPLGIVSLIFSIIMIYSAIALGQMFTHHKVAGAVVWYIAEYTIVQLGFSLLINLPLTNLYFNSYSNNIYIGDFLKPVMTSFTIITIILSIVLYFITEYLLNKKLNLE